MAYDLEEQESIDQMKAWWDRWGTPVTSVVCVCCLAFAGWNGWNWWQRNQAAKASQIYAALQNAVATHDLKNVQSLSAGLISEYSSTLYAPLAAFASAQSASDAGDLVDAKAKLNWVIEKSGRPEYDTVARVRLAGVLFDEGKTAEMEALIREVFDEGKLDEAAAVLAAAKPAEAQKVLVLDRQGDIWAAKGDLQKARDAWTQAQAALNPQDPLNRVLELKLAALPSAS